MFFVDDFPRSVPDRANHRPPWRTVPERTVTDVPERTVTDVPERTVTDVPERTVTEAACRYSGYKSPFFLTIALILVS